MTPMHGMRVMILEDEPLVAMTLEDLLEDIGCEVAASVGSIEEGIATARSATFDIAVLDININGRRSDPVAHILQQRGIPYFFATGYGRAGVTEPDAVVVAKPYDVAAIAKAISDLVVR